MNWPLRHFVMMPMCQSSDQSVLAGFDWSFNNLSRSLLTTQSAMQELNPRVQQVMTDCLNKPELADSLRGPSDSTRGPSQMCHDIPIAGLHRNKWAHCSLCGFLDHPWSLPTGWATPNLPFGYLSDSSSLPGIACYPKPTYGVIIIKKYMNVLRYIIMYINCISMCNNN